MGQNSKTADVLYLLLNSVNKYLCGLSFVQMVACGDSYTVSGTEDNALYMWGKGPQHTPPPSDEGTKNSTEMSNLEVPQDKKRERHHSAGSLGSTSSLTRLVEKGSRDASPAPSLSKYITGSFFFFFFFFLIVYYVCWQACRLSILSVLEIFKNKTKTKNKQTWGADSVAIVICGLYKACAPKAAESLCCSKWFVE